MLTCAIPTTAPQTRPSHCRFGKKNVNGSAKTEVEHAQQTCSQMLEKADYLASTLTTKQVHRLRYEDLLQQPDRAWAKVMAFVRNGSGGDYDDDAPIDQHAMAKVRVCARTTSDEHRSRLVQNPRGRC